MDPLDRLNTFVLKSYLKLEQTLVSVLTGCTSPALLYLTNVRPCCPSRRCRHVRALVSAGTLLSHVEVQLTVISSAAPLVCVIVDICSSANLPRPLYLALWSPVELDFVWGFGSPDL